tara:strand:- start:6930 stop:7469 length:540 start_codon:yes stop_codon:yes gene_type:complete
MVKTPTRKRKPPKATEHDPSRRRARGLLTVGTSLPHLAAPALRKRGFAQARLITEWPSIVGEALARETVPQKLVFQRGSKTDAILHLRVASGYALELQHIAPQIIARINGFFGFRAVADLRYAQGPIPPQRRPRRVTPPRLSDVDEAALRRTVGDMGDSDLQQALLRLGRAVRMGRESS